MIEYKVGGYINGTPKRYQEGLRFDITDSGATLIAYFNRPTVNEVEMFKRGKLKFGYYTYKNVIMLLAKIGELDWMDAPYSVHLSKGLTDLGTLNDTEGLAITIMLVDAHDGTIVNMRLVGANHRLSEGLFKAIEVQKQIPFDGYDQNINYIFRTYSTKELVKRASMVENLRVEK